MDRCRESIEDPIKWVEHKFSWSGCAINQYELEQFVIESLIGISDWLINSFNLEEAEIELLIGMAGNASHAMDAMTQAI